MTRDEWRQLFIVRRDLTGESFNDATIDAWGTAFPALAYGAGRTAMTAAAKEHDRVSLHGFTTALPHREPSRRHTTPLGAADCPECDGSGFRPDPDSEPRVTRWGRCGACRR